MLEKIDAGSRDRWRSDLEQIKALGFNSVRTWVEWTAGEPRPGEYQFGNLELLADLTAEVGLKFLVQVYVDSAPEWVGERFPNGQFVAQSGEVIPSQAAPGYCFDHSGVRERILAFYREAARVAGRYSHFAGWDLWSEPHIINWAIIDFIPNASFCYCEPSQQRFRSWLQNKYKSLQSLNESWYRTFTEWEQVEPPRFGTILSYTDFIDWRIYIQRKLAEDLRMRSQAVRNVDGGALVTSHAAVPSLFTSPLWGVGAPDDWLMADVVDYWGTSIYPKHSFPDRHWSRQRLSVIADFIRSSGRQNGGFVVGELQAGMGIRGTVVGNPVTTSDHDLWVWTMLSRGARAINVYAYYPMSTGYEAGGYGLVNLDGTITPRAEAIGELARVVTRNQDFLLRARPLEAEVAIVYNPLSYLVGGEQHLSRSGAVPDSLTGIYQAFRQANMAVDFVHLRDLENGGISDYRVLFLPYPLMLTRAAARGLEAFVSAGGTLVAEARIGWNDDRGHAQSTIPGFGLDKVFGVRETVLKMEESVPISISTEDTVLGDLKSGDELVGRGIRQGLQPDQQARILAHFEDGSPAVTLASYGRGKAIAIGSFLGMASAQGNTRNNETFFVEVAREAGVRTVLELDGLPEDVEIRILKSEDRLMLFLFNQDHGSRSLNLPFQQGIDVRTEELLNVSTVELQPGEIKILSISRVQDE